MNKYAIIGIVLILILFIGSVGYLFTVGENFKSTSINSDGEGFEIAITAAMFGNYAKNNPDAEGTIIPECENMASEDHLDCIAALSPNEETKIACQNAFNTLKEHTSKIQKENSVILGLKVLTTPNSCVGSYGENCLSEIDFYGLSAGFTAMEACFEKLE